MDGTAAAIARIEAIAQQDVGRGAEAMFAAARGGLATAAASLAAQDRPRIGIITGFFVPHGQPPAAETDGPAGATLLAHAILAAGGTCRIATDTPCRNACRVALEAAGIGSVPVDSIAPGEPVEPLVALWREQDLRMVVSVERCGPAADGRPRNMRGEDISAHTAPLHALFAAGPWSTVGIGDGGNEIGMGSLPAGTIQAHVPHGGAIACVVPADHLIVAGVSHWGVYALLAALARLRPDWRPAMLGALDAALDTRIVAAMVARGPAVDGVSLRQAETIDTMPMAVHAAKLAAIRAMADAA